MPKMFYTFRCPIHGEFDIRLNMMDDNLQEQPCRHEHHIFPTSINTTICGIPSPRVFNHYGHYYPDCLWNKDGSKQDPAELPPAPMDHQYGWHGFGESKLHVEKREEKDE